MFVMRMEMCEMPTKPDHLQVLIRYQKWRTSYADVPMEDPRIISEALNWAIKELSERKNGKTK